MEALGIDLKILIAQIINFLIVLFLLKKFLYVPILKMLDDRKTNIEKGMKDSEEAKKLLESVEVETANKNKQAFADAQKIVDEAEKNANTKAQTIVKKANEQADQIIKRAEEEASGAKTRALNDAKNQIGSLVSLSLDKIIGNDLDSAQKEKLTAKAIEEL